MTIRTPSSGEQLRVDLLDPAWCQRWTDRRPGWRRTNEGGFDPSLYPARRFVERHHYSGS
ncbi:hypothetical protein ACIRPK_23910 [Kitasatospora sp. NPDC101801]|uniref:hypothetical protein n=1 Tax=Kitasatospora sp. NPDC101801 TaxID=3364103 RepID=UPI00380F98D5